LCYFFRNEGLIEEREMPERLKKDGSIWNTGTEAAMPRTPERSDPALAAGDEPRNRFPFMRNAV